MSSNTRTPYTGKSRSAAISAAAAPSSLAASTAPRMHEALQRDAGLKRDRREREFLASEIASKAVRLAGRSYRIIACRSIQ